MKIVDDYLEVTEPEIAVLFLEEKVFLNYHEGKLAMVSKDGDCPFTIFVNKNTDNDYENWAYICIPKETVKKVCEAKEGKACFWWAPKFKKLRYCEANTAEYRIVVTQRWRTVCVIKANALTIGKTVGELRELMEWME